jgi:hypothetical protein
MWNRMQFFETDFRSLQDVRLCGVNEPAREVNESIISRGYCVGCIIFFKMQRYEKQYCLKENFAFFTIKLWCFLALLFRKQFLLHYISAGLPNSLFAIDPSIKLKDEPYHAPTTKC